jgi:O-antigen ligase
MIVRAMYLCLAVIYLISIDALSGIGLGQVSLSGALSLAIPYLGAILIPIGVFRALRRGRSVLGGGGPAAAILLFALLAAVSAAASPFEEAVQNAAVYLIFATTVIIGFLFWDDRQAEGSLLSLRWAALVSAILAFVSLALGAGVYGVRSIGALGLVYLAILLPFRGSNVLLRFGPLIVALILLLSLSRTALVIGVVSLLFLVLRSAPRRRLAQLLTAIPVMVAAGYWLLFEYAPVRDRFLTGDAAFALGGLQINTSGRVTLWTTTIDSAMESLLTGKGAGSSSALLNGMFNISHPHNDYLRIFHDFGAPGLVLFVLALGWMIARLWRAARRSDSAVHWSAFIALTTSAALAITDNVFVYSFVMFPVGLLVGMSLASAVDEHSPFKRTAAIVDSRHALVRRQR